MEKLRPSRDLSKYKQIINYIYMQIYTFTFIYTQFLGRGIEREKGKQGRERKRKEKGEFIFKIITEQRIKKNKN